MRRSSWLVAAAAVLAAAAVQAAPVSQQIGAGDTALLFGGSDAEGGIGDWYLSNGVVQAIVDNVGVQGDLSGLVPGSEPPIQAEINPTGGTLIDLGRVGANDDQLAQMFTVGGLSTSNFILYDAASAPSPGVVRVSGKLLFPPASPPSAPCADVVTDYSASGSDPYIVVTTTATNNCAAPLTGFGGFLDVFIWTQRGLLPFSGGGTGLIGGKGFDHAVLDLSNPAAALELIAFMAAPGELGPADGIMDTSNLTTSGEVSYGLVGVTATIDSDGVGPNPPVVSPVNSLFGVSSSLISALGNIPGNASAVGATITYVRHIYVGDHNDVASSGNGAVTELAGRIPFGTGTISGDVDAADTPDVEASILIRRLGRCSGNPSISCKVTSPDCTGNGTCQDPVPTTGFIPNYAVSHVRTDPTGAFSGIVLPQGDYELTVSSAERNDVVVKPVVVGAGDTPVAVPALSARGTVEFVVKERAKGSPLLPAKLVFKGVTPTPDPRFHRDLKASLGGNDIQPETFGGTQAGTSGHAAGQGNIVYTATGEGDIQVRPGTYDIYASRGMEYGVQVKRVTVGAGGSTAVDFRLRRVLKRKTKNALSADFHVHSGRSLDASAPLRDRTAAFAGEGVEVMISTDHDKHVDYAPIIAAFGLGDRITSIVGNEITGSVPNEPNFPNSIGHINAWPLPLLPGEPRDGAIEDEFVAPNWVFKRLRDQGAEVVQYNHPRAGVSGITSIGIFNNIGCFRCANDIDTTCSVDTDCPAAPAPQDCTCVGYQPDRPIGMAPNDILLDKGVLGPGSPDNPDGTRNIDFDVMEIMNAARDTDFPAYREMRRDWLSLLNQGIYRPGTGVSDSHRITVEHAGWARTYVRGVGDDPAALDVSAFDAQVKAGDMLMAAGPYIEAEIRAPHKVKGEMGQTVSIPDGRVRLKIRVTSAAWIPVEEVRVIANGFVVASFDETTRPRVIPTPTNFQANGGTRRFSTTFRYDITQDTYFIVEAGAKIPASIGTLPTPPPIVDIVEPGVVPLAITNPIFVDVDGGGFDPPGLPVLSMASATPRPSGLWDRIVGAVERFAARLTGTAIAQDAAPGEMTGVTEEEKAEAVKKGEYFPLREFKIPDEAVEAARKAAEQGAQPAAPAGEQ
jgi:hypothetical protein